MVTLLLDSAQLELALSGTERALAFQRESIRIERAHIEKVQLTQDPWTWVRGARKSGTHVPGVVAAGTWASIAGDEFVMLRGRKPGVVISLTHEAPYQRVLVTTRHGIALVQALNLPIGEGAEVTELAEAEPTARARRPRPATA